MKVLNFVSKNYSSSNTECACVTGCGCSCDDGTAE